MAGNVRSTQAQSTSALDVKASQLTVSFGGSSSDYDQAEDIKSPGLKFANTVILTGGIEPSYALITIPVSQDLDEFAPTVALVGTGPTGKVKLTSRCRIDWYDSIQKKKIAVLCGSIVQYNHELGEDTATALVADDRWLMDKVTVWGRVRAKLDPASGTWTQWLDNSPCVFNQWGPDCVDVPGSGPRFSSDYQWGNNSSFYKEPGQPATTSARSWRLSDIYEYLIQMYTESESCGFGQIIFQGGVECNRVQGWCYVPAIGNGCWDQLEFQRVKKNFSLQGKTLITAMQDVCRAAGAFDMYCQPVNGTFRSIVTPVNMNPDRFKGVILNLPSRYNWDLSKIVTDPAAIQKGQVSESVVNYHDRVEIIGESPWVELMTAYCPNKTGMTTDPDKLGMDILEAAWSAADEAAFKALILATGDTELAFKNACKVYPEVYCSYRVNPAKFVEAMAGSKYANWKMVSYPRILPHILTNDVPAGTSQEQNPNNWIPKQIHFEYWDEYGGTGAWEAADVADGLMLSPERTTILVPQLRDNKQTWKSDGAYDSATMVPLSFRATIAVELPSPLASRSGGNGNGPSDPNFTSGRINYSRNKFTYTGLGIPDAKDYIEYLRLASSRPNGSDQPEPELSQNYPPKMTAGNELFSDKPSETSGRQPTHARARLKDVKRIEYTGQIILSSFHTGIKPGTNIRIFGGGSILPIAVCKSVRLDANAQNITVELVSHDSRVIYDMPWAGIVKESPPTENGNEGNTANPSKSKTDATATDKKPEEAYPMTPEQKEKYNKAMDIYKKDDEAAGGRAERAQSVMDLLDVKAPEKKAEATKAEEYETE